MKKNNAERILPHDNQAEQAVLGSIFINKKAFPLIISKLKPEHFYNPTLGILYRELIQMYKKNIPIDLVTAVDYLRRNNCLEGIGGAATLANVADSVPTWSNVERYADIVYEKALKRNLIDVGVRITDDAFSDDSLDSLLENAQKDFLDIANNHVEKKVKGLDDVMKEVFDNIEYATKNAGKLLGIPSGLKSLDTLLLGFKSSDLIILAARPSMGKTALALNFAYNAAKNSIPTLFFSIEMASEQLGTRLLSIESGVDSKKIQTANFTDKEKTVVMSGIGKLSDIPLHIEDRGGLTTLEFRSITRSMLIKSDIKLIVIDYLQLMRGSGAENRMQEVSEVVRDLKAFAKEVNIPIIALSQLRRGVEDRADKTPMLSDLRETGEIEQTADVVMFLHRDDYYNQTIVGQGGQVMDSQLRNISKTDLIVSKHRNGETGKINLMYKRDISKFLCTEKVGVE